MKLRIQYTGQLRTAAGRAEEELELPDRATLPVLLGSLAARLGDSAAPHLLTAAGRAPCGLLIVVNDSVITASHAATTVLRPGDIVTLLPPIAGG